MATSDIPSPAHRFVSTGSLPSSPRVQELVEEAWRLFADHRAGVVSEVYPALAMVDPDRFGISVVRTDGALFEAGDCRVEFPIMSVAKPFAFALLCDQVGIEGARATIGVNATGDAFNSIVATERSPDGRTNPMVNSGALATVGHLGEGPMEERWVDLHTQLSRLAGRPLRLDESTYASAMATNHTNRDLVAVLERRGCLVHDPSETLDIYTRQCCLGATARDLGVMGATLADGGVNPLTGEQVLSADACRATLVVMATAGLYETSGDWLLDVGLPGKSGIGGGIVTVSPGKGALGTFSPRLDAAGNSVRGLLVARYLSQTLGLDLFASEPARRQGQ